MLKSVVVTLMIPAAFLAVGCGRKAPAPTINWRMTQVVAPQADKLWEVTNRSFNDSGDGYDPAKISEEDWSHLRTAGQQLKEQALELAKPGNHLVLRSGETIMGQAASNASVSRTQAPWKAASPQEIQAMINADPTLFAQRAKALEQAADTLEKAADAKDVRALYQMSSQLDEVCDGCHEKFWGTDEPPPYPG